MSSKLAPSSQLKLDWVYGYRGMQCHTNLFITSQEDRLVYFVAALGIVLDIRQHKQYYYFEHDDDVISLSMSLDGDLVATGQIGKAPHICVWSTKTMETKSILKDQHTHGICSLAFSDDNTFLVSIGLDPNATMNIWDWKKGKVLSTTRAHSDRVFDASFMSHDSTPKFVTCGVKHIKFWTLTGNTLTNKKGIFGKTGEIQTIFCVCLSISDSSACYSGTANGDIYVWRENNLDKVLPTVHQGAIYSIEKCSQGYVTGGKDGCVVLFDRSFLQTTKINLKDTSVGYPNLIVRSVHWKFNKVVVGTQGSDIIEINISTPNKPQSLMMGHSEGELWALAVHPKKSIFATASDDCSIRVWQMSDKGCLSVCRIDNKIRSCGFNNDGSLLAIGLLDGSFRVLKSRDLSETFRFQDRKEVIHELKFSPDGKWLAVGSNDNFVDFYDTSANFKRTGTCKGNSSFITHIDWSTDSTFIKTNSGAAECLIFKAPGGEHVIQSDTLKGIKWQQSTGVLGPELIGIWEKYTDTNDINGADVNFNAGIIATGDDFGLVKIFRYPSPLKGAHFKKYIGHSAHVTNIRWSADGKYLISIGGADMSIFQWSLTSGNLDAMDGTGFQGDSNTEASDSGLSDVGPCNSDIAAEIQTKYDRVISKDDVNRLQKVTKEDLTDGVKRKKAPSQGIELEWIHGYRGYDCRNNLFYLRSGEIVYHLAAVGIVLNLNTKTQRFYTSHTDDILCLALHPTMELVATGEVGKDPTIHIWAADTMKVVSILKGQHERGVCAVDFSRDGKRLASIGLDDNHCIVVWNWKTGEKLASTRAHNDKLFVIKWDPHRDDNLVTVGMKYIRFWTQVGGGFTSKRGTYGTVASLDTQLCAAYSPTVPGLCYTGGANGFAYVWNDNILQSTIKTHEGGCYAIDAMAKGFVTGGRDGSIKLYDETFTNIYKSYSLKPASLAKGHMLSSSCPAIRSVMLGKDKILIGTKNGEILEVSAEGQIEVVVQGHGEGEIWGLAVHPTMNICCTVSDDCNLMIWQIEPSKHKLLKVSKLKGPARCCDICCDGSAVAVGFKDGSFTVFNISNLTEITSNHHRKEEISDIKFSPAPGKYLAVGSHDNFVDIYSVTSHQRLSVCKGSSSYITHIDWDIDGKLIMSNSGAKEQLFYEVPRGTRQNVAKSEVEKINWYSWTSVLGDSCTGIWPPKCDVTDINAVSRTTDGKVLASGDDFGRIKLFEFPSKTKFAKYKQYLGHSAHVTNVRWLKNDEYLLSVGGADTSLMVWKHRRTALSPLESARLKKCGDQSEVNDTDSEEENGFDSDVEREKKMDYTCKTFSGRQALQQKEFLKPQVIIPPEKKDILKNIVTRDQALLPKVMSPITVKLSKSTESNVQAIKRLKVTPKSGSSRNNGDLPIPMIRKVTGLKLTHVHGYRGFDCRNNLHYIDGDGSTIVYHAAAVGIIHNLVSGAQSFFMDHTDDILCLTINRHPKYKGVVASGQLGDIPEIHVWNSLDCSLISTIKGTHTAGVCSVDFSSTGTILVSVGIDRDHTIAVWKWKEGTCLASAKGHAERIFLAEFRPDSDSLFVDVGVKHVTFWTVAGSQLVPTNGKIPETFINKPRMTTMLSVAFGTDDVTYTGAMSGAVWVWKSGILIRQVEKAHSGPVFVLYTTLIDGLIVSGGKEKIKDTGSVKLWDQDMNKCKPFHLLETINIRGTASTTGPLEEKSLEVIRSISRVKGKILLGTQDNDILEINEKTGSIEYLVQGHGEGLIDGLAIHPMLPRYASASEDGTVRIWDLNTKKLIQKLTTGSACCLDFSPNGHYLSVGLKSGAFLILSANSYRLLFRKKNRGKSIIDIKFSPSGSLFAISSEDNVIDIYEVSHSSNTISSGDLNTPNGTFTAQRLCYCKDLNSSAKTLDFSVDSKYLRCTLTDYTVKIYSAIDGQLIMDSSVIDKITWSSWSSIIGDEVAGIWPDQSEKADLNIAVVSHENNVTVTGDDYGLVKLFTDFPVNKVNGGAVVPAGIYRGHSANVTNVRFVNDDSHLVSTGGEDCCVFLWKCS